MTPWLPVTAILIGLSILCSATGIMCSSAAQQRLSDYRSFWDRQSVEHRFAWFRLVLPFQICLLPGLLICAQMPKYALPAVTLLLLMEIAPWGLLHRCRRQQKRQLLEQLDTMLLSLSNSVAVTGNLTYALTDVIPGEPEPMRSELRKVMSAIRLGSTVESALLAFASRTELPEFSAVVTQLVIGKKTGGDLRHVLKINAASLREMRRLEGVIQTRTAEGRGQAVVMGLIPPALCGLLHLLHPEWLKPLWSSPAGWVLLAICAILEITAILLIRRIMAVEL